MTDRGCPWECDSSRASSYPAIGLLCRRHITIDHIIYIGRESNQLEDVDAGRVRAWERESGGTSRRILIDAHLGEGVGEFVGRRFQGRRVNRNPVAAVNCCGRYR